MCRQNGKLCRYDGERWRLDKEVGRYEKEPDRYDEDRVELKKSGVAMTKNSRSYGEAGWVDMKKTHDITHDEEQCRSDEEMGI